MGESEVSESEATFSRWEQYEALEGYMECALWASYWQEDDGNGASFDEIDHDGLADEAVVSMTNDLFPFMLDNAEDLQDMPLAQIGHDFWLTRNRHGAGFWDRGLGERGTRLTDAAHAYGSSDLYLGDDGKVYVS